VSVALLSSDGTLELIDPGNELGVGSDELASDLLCSCEMEDLALEPSLLGCELVGLKFGDRAPSVFGGLKYRGTGRHVLTATAAGKGSLPGRLG
jgi:hypothetical protein